MLKTPSPSKTFNALVWTLEQHTLMKDNESLLHILINPFSPILLCDHHFGVDDVPKHTPIALRPVDEKNAHLVAHMDIVCCQTDQLQTFADRILPLLNNRIILFTHKWNLPAVARSNWTDSVRQNPIVAHWFSQNPIYESDETYSAFPYGIRETSLEAYAAALLEFSGRKDTLVQHLHLASTNKERGLLPERPKLDLNEYYRNVARAKFLLSPPGDRPDCYRHWEAVGLGTVPISSLNETHFRPLFGESMTFLPSIAAMLPLLDNSSAMALSYEEPSRHIVFSAFWASRVRQTKIRLLGADK